ncbi:uncharacterized protein LOC142589770 [Dermacentor variabilis]|uniref:uncharacterized protein LOC142589770 n=1 Tax=Dermacentor variabilis TaxID=34621 RepID=UPI003F5B5143
MLGPPNGRTLSRALAGFFFACFFAFAYIAVPNIASGVCRHHVFAPPSCFCNVVPCSPRPVAAPSGAAHLKLTVSDSSGFHLRSKTWPCGKYGLKESAGLISLQRDGPAPVRPRDAVDAEEKEEDWPAVLAPVKLSCFRHPRLADARVEPMDETSKCSSKSKLKKKKRHGSTCSAGSSSSSGKRQAAPASGTASAVMSGSESAAGPGSPPPVPALLIRKGSKSSTSSKSSKDRSSRDTRYVHGQPKVPPALDIFSREHSSMASPITSPTTALNAAQSTAQGQAQAEAAQRGPAQDPAQASAQQGGTGNPRQ